MNRLAGPAALLVVWILMWGELTPANVLSGVVVVGVVVAVDTRLRRPRSHRISPVGMMLLGVDLIGRLVVSSIQVARTVVQPTPERLRAGVVSAPLRTDSTLVATVLADMISLTPGTVTLDVRPAPPRLIVHVLGLGDPDEVLDDIAVLEDRVLRAIRPIGTDVAGTPSGPGGAT